MNNAIERIEHLEEKHNIENIAIDVLEGLLRDFCSNDKADKTIKVDELKRGGVTVKTVEDKVNERFLDDESMSEKLNNAEIEILQNRIDCLQYQNEVNVQRLCKMMEVEEKLRHDTKEKEEKIKRVVNENKELQKEMKVKKKFVFKM